MGGFMEGQPFDYFNNLPQYQQDLQARTAGLASQQLGQPNTAMPAQMYQDVMRAYGVPSTAYDAMGIMSALMGTSPVTTSPFSTFQPTGSTIPYTPGAQDPADIPPDYTNYNKRFTDPNNPDTGDTLPYLMREQNPYAPWRNRPGGQIRNTREGK